MPAASEAIATDSLLSHTQSGQTHRMSNTRQRDINQQLKKEKTLMDKKNLMPQAAQPVNRTTTGQLPAELAQLSEEALQQYGDEAYSASVLASASVQASMRETQLTQFL